MNARAISNSLKDSEQIFLDFLPKWRIENDEFGVVTASNDEYYYGLQMLIQTIRGKVHCTVIDLGLNNYQVHWLESQPGVQVVKYEVEEATEKTSWRKPWWIELSPYKYKLWLDADCLVVGDLTPIFDRIKQNPLVMMHPMKSKAPIQANPNYFLKRKLKVPLRDKPVQCGVLGFCLEREQDQKLVTAWQEVITSCLEDPKVKSHIHYWDEGAMFVAVQVTDSNDYIVTDRPGWDRFQTLRYSYSHEDFYKRLTIRDEDIVIHLVGKKPWFEWVWRPYP